MALRISHTVLPPGRDAATAPHRQTTHNDTYLNAWVQRRLLRGWTAAQIERVLAAYRQAQALLPQGRAT